MCDDIMSVRFFVTPVRRYAGASLRQRVASNRVTMLYLSTMRSIDYLADPRAQASMLLPSGSNTNAP